jgi:hypothetical protein
LPAGRIRTPDLGCHDFQETTTPFNDGGARLAGELFSAHHKCKLMV